MSEKTIMVWFRNDLRVRDNEVLTEALSKGDKVLPLYCFDPRYFARTGKGTRKTGAFRLRFLLESIAELRESLKRLGGDLMVRVGVPEDIIPELCVKYKVHEVYHHREVGPKETEISENVEAALWRLKINLKHFIGHTLYHKEDLPFSIKSIPNNFQVFKKKLERDCIVRACFPAPQRVTVPDTMEPGDLPAFEDMGLECCEIASASADVHFKGGEQSAQEWIEALLGEGEKNSRIQLQVFTSKLSPWLSFGCISSREAYWMVQSFRKIMPKLSGNIVNELLWRDYFRFMLKKHGAILTNPLEEMSLDQLDHAEFEVYQNWVNGETADPVVNACMKELKTSGYISEACRYFVGTYLVQQLGLHWALGSAYFEDTLIDFAPASNIGCWAFILGDSVVSSTKIVMPDAEQLLQDADLKKWFKQNVKPKKALQV